eukprot:12387728-Karenia_brevis.AAC.1
MHSMVSMPNRADQGIASFKRQGFRNGEVALLKTFQPKLCTDWWVSAAGGGDGAGPGVRLRPTC